jgi:hypothetical protein
MSESLTYGSVGGPVGQPPALPGTLGFCLLWESSTQYFGGVSYSVEFAFRLFLPVLLLSRKGIL